MKKPLLLMLYFGLLLFNILVFLFSCIVAISDGQGALIFIFSIPVMLVVFLLARQLLLRSQLRTVSVFGLALTLPLKILSTAILIFFVLLPIPFLNQAPALFMTALGTGFESITGKTPYTYFRERNSFPNLLAREIKNLNGNGKIDFDKIGVSFAWDHVCIFGPYTDNAKAQSVLKMDWKIEERSEIKYSDSVNALVFLYQGQVNQVVDLKRGVADFTDLDLCLDRPKATFELRMDVNGREILHHLQ